MHLQPHQLEAIRNLLAVAVEVVQDRACTCAEEQDGAPDAPQARCVYCMAGMGTHVLTGLDPRCAELPLMERIERLRAIVWWQPATEPAPALLAACQQALDYIDQANAAGLLEACKRLVAVYAFDARHQEQAIGQAQDAINRTTTERTESAITAMLAEAIRAAGGAHAQQPDVATLARAYFEARDAWAAGIEALRMFEPDDAVQALKRRRDEAEAALRAAVDGQR